jgi:hypothetical protein
MSILDREPGRRFSLRLAAGIVALAIATALLVAAAPAAETPACCPCAEEAAYAADMWNAFAQRGTRMQKARQTLIDCLDSASR